MRRRRLTFYWVVAAEHREPLISLGNSRQLLFYSEKILELLIRAMRNIIKELTQSFTAPKKEAWKPTLQRFVF